MKIVVAFENLMLDIYNSSYGPFSRTATGCPVLTLQVIHDIFLRLRLITYMKNLSSPVQVSLHDKLSYHVLKNINCKIMEMAFLMSQP